MIRIKHHVVGYNRAIGQAFFLNTSLFGAALLISLFLFSRQAFISGVLASLIGYAYSCRYSTPRVLKDTGLIALNGFFLGIAMASLYRESVPYYFCLVMGALLLPLVTKASYEVLQHWKLSPLIVPYILAVWTLWSCHRGIGLELQPTAWPEHIASLPAYHPQWSLVYRLAWAVFESMGRLLFIPDPRFGALVLVLIAAFSPRRAIFFFLGTVIATVMAWYLTQSASAWEYGYFSFCAGLIGLGMASMPEKFSCRTILLFCAVSAVFTVAISRFLGQLQLPVLSTPYVATLWLALLSRTPRVSMSWAPSKRGYAQLLQGPEVSLDQMAHVDQPVPEKAA
jgi:urea transporter